MAVTLSDISKVVGTSVNTVSRALRDMPDISEATKRKVRAAARKLGYTPNAMARSLVLGRSHMIGLVATQITNPVRNEFIECLRSRLEATGYHLLVSGLDRNPDEQVKTVEELIGRRIDGLIMAGFYGGEFAGSALEERLLAYRQGGAPVIIIGEGEDLRLDVIGVDYETAAVRLVEHLAGLGRRRIVALGPPGEETPRLRGYRAGMAGRGIEEHTRVFEAGYADLASGRRAPRAYGEKHGDPPDAFMAYNDLQAIGLICGCSEMGLRVPDDVAVTGYDNTELSQYTTPPLTTAGASVRSLMEAAVELLFERMNSRGPVETAHRLQAPEIHFRPSSGAESS